MTTAKKKKHPPRPDANRPWSQLNVYEQNAEYSRALHAYSQGKGDNPQGRNHYNKQRAQAEHKT